MKFTLDGAQTIVSLNLEEAREMAKYDHRTSEYWPTLIGERLWFLNMLNNIETEPVKHGRWIEVSDGSGYVGEPCEACSVCGMQTDYPSNYCPNCGARMQSTMGQVKHGHWVKYGSPLFSEWECSECGERHTGNDLPDKCPHCKAKMDEVEE